MLYSMLQSGITRALMSHRWYACYNYVLLSQMRSALVVGVIGWLYSPLLPSRVENSCGVNLSRVGNMTPGDPRKNGGLILPVTR